MSVPGYPYAQPQKSAGAYVLLALFLGTLGAHRFYAGDSRGGAIMLSAWLCAAVLLLVGIGVIIWLVLLGWSVVDLSRTNEVLYAHRPGPIQEGWGKGWDQR